MLPLALVRRTLAFLLVVGLSACRRDPISLLPDGGRPRDAATEPDAAAWSSCFPGETRCFRDFYYQRCVAAGELSRAETTNCLEQQGVCLEGVGCRPCRAGALRCNEEGNTVERCRMDNSGYDPVETCDIDRGIVCRGDRCRALCEDQTVVGTNIGCEYYSVDLDNAQLGVGETAASQQYAVVVSNPDPQFTARVVIERNANPPGMPPRIERVASAVIPPQDLEVFPLNAREVDCSAPGTFNTGSHSCLSSQAYRVTSTIPVIAYQFNPLENGLQFSNDASLLLPTNSLSGEYTVLGYPQTLASVPLETALNPASPVDLRGFVTIVGTAESTRVRVTPHVEVLGFGGVMGPRFAANAPLEVTLGPFDVLNLETHGFRADLSGTLVSASRPVVVFAGSECSDVPDWGDLNDRRCCCDHLEAQQFPRNTLGNRYVAVHTPNRTSRVRTAGATVGLQTEEPEFFRILAVNPGETRIRTTLPSPLPDGGPGQFEFTLRQNEVRVVRATSHFEVEASGPVYVANFMSSQLNTGIPLNFPGGDGSFIPMPPEEQWRQQYVFLTPDRYAFDFVTIVAPTGTVPSLDGDRLPTNDCEVQRSDSCVDTRTMRCPPPRYTIYACQFSFPIINPDLPYPDNVSAGRQRDGVHIVTADRPVGVIVSGFDLRVSYGYPAGTQLRPLF